MEQPFRIWPYKLSKVENLEEGKFAVAGVLVDKQGDLSFIDDGTGKVPVVMKHDLEVGKFVRVFGRIVDKQIQGDLIQDLDKIDKFLYAEVIDLIHG